MADAPELWQKTDRAEPKKIIAEFIGSLLFMFIGGACSANSTHFGDDGMGIVVAALGNGFTLAVCVYCTCKISGGHLNPAVSTGFVACGLPNFRTGSYIGYVIAQLTGAAVGAILLFICMPAAALEAHHGHGAFATLGMLSLRHPMAVFFSEFFSTFFMVFTVFGVVHSYNCASVGPLAIGLALACACFGFYPYTGSCFNPARTLAPILVFGVGKYPWVYTLQLIAQTLGGFFAGKIFQRAFLLKR
eukprot:CAMPEP_0114552906 /NCGR_PEP_ID=MMETSP0114-20121206/7371_1 /TAXON_ID=31324 /ORGANISM="Goniomonas sp, Strain m" /LENGTH=245 /DNA_ID=CAMNT_0001737807 /DNA_START=49 /DNA_END=786 /DNA_ORIENTATION=+